MVDLHELAAALVADPTRHEDILRDIDRLPDWAAKPMAYITQRLDAGEDLRDAVYGLVRSGRGVKVADILLAHLEPVRPYETRLTASCRIGVGAVTFGIWGFPDAAGALVEDAETARKLAAELLTWADSCPP